MRSSACMTNRTDPTPRQETPGHARRATARRRRQPQAAAGADRPSYDDLARRARFADTLAGEVAFAEPPVKDCLTSDELDMLLKLHPDGTARFWGALARHDAKT